MIKSLLIFVRKKIIFEEIEGKEKSIARWIQHI